MTDQNYESNFGQGLVYMTTAMGLEDSEPKSPIEATAWFSFLSLITPVWQMDTHWGWVCHLCNAEYRFSVTSRCLNDGHVFCLNSSPSGQACRDIFGARGIRLGQKLNISDCWKDCAYPFQCKERKRGVFWTIREIKPA